jgi:hypothetical protein
VGGGGESDDAGVADAPSWGLAPGDDGVGEFFEGHSPVAPDASSEGYGLELVEWDAKRHEGVGQRAHGHDTAPLARMRREQFPDALGSLGLVLDERQHAGPGLVWRVFEVRRSGNLGGALGRGLVGYEERPFKISHQFIVLALIDSLLFLEVTVVHPSNSVGRHEASQVACAPRRGRVLH